MKSLNSAKRMKSHFPFLGYCLIARFSDKAKVPLIGIGLGSADKGFINIFADSEIPIISYRDAMRSRLGGKQDNITSMSPREITSMARDIIDSSRQDAIIYPGSTNTISDLFWKPGISIPKYMRLEAANSIFKMAMTIRSLEIGYPAIFSCDAAHYPVVALGGKVAPVLKEPGRVMHDSNTHHDIIIKKERWLHKVAEEITQQKDGDGNVIIKDVCSTHPLSPTKLPEGSVLLAAAKDGSPSVFTIMPYIMGIVDHLEAEPPVIVRVENGFELEEKKEGTVSLDGLKLWEKILDKFLKVAASDGNKQPVDNNRFSPRIQEILYAKDLSELGKQQFTVRGR